MYPSNLLPETERRNNQQEASAIQKDKVKHQLHPSGSDSSSWHSF